MIKVGVLGSGQLALLMAKASQEANVELCAFGPQSSALLKNYCPTVNCDFNDTESLKNFVDSVDVLTFETENIPDPVLQHRWLTQKLLPSAESLTIFQNRFFEKNCFIQHGINTTRFAPVFDSLNLAVAAKLTGFPALLKTNRDGYDGRGQILVSSQKELEKAWQDLGYVPCILEALVHFEQEVSIVAVRDRFGNIVFYPISQNFHRQGQIRLALVTGNHPLQSRAEQIISPLMQALNYTGCMTMEFFVKDNDLIINEVAPRVHNSGHWTIDASNCSQFTNHLKAISGQEVTAPVTKLPAAMINLIGKIPSVSTRHEMVKYQIYDYGKTWKPERKVGHINLTGTPLATDVFFQILSEILEITGEQELSAWVQHYAQHVA